MSDCRSHSNKRITLEGARNVGRLFFNLKPTEVLIHDEANLATFLLGPSMMVLNLT